MFQSSVSKQGKEKRRQKKINNDRTQLILLILKSTNILKVIALSLLQHKRKLHQCIYIFMYMCLYR